MTLWHNAAFAFRGWVQTDQVVEANNRRDEERLEMDSTI